MVQKYGKLIYGWDYSKDLIKPLLEKLGNEWVDTSYGNDVSMSIGWHGYKNHYLTLYLPNANVNEPIEENYSTFNLLYTDECNGTIESSPYSKLNIASLEDAIQECIKQSKLIKEKFFNDKNHI